MILVYLNLKETSFLRVKFGTKLSGCFFLANSFCRLFPNDMLFLQDELDEKKTYYVEVKILQSYDPGRSFISKLHCYSYLVYDTLIPYTSIQHFQNLSLLLLERFISKHQLDDLQIDYVFNKLKVF